MMANGGARKSADLTAHPESRLLEVEKARTCLLNIIDFAIIEGAQLRAPTFVHFLRRARDELERLNNPCPACGEPRAPTKCAQ